MQPIPQIGTLAEHAFTVTQEMCPHFEDQLVHPVCATWTLVHQLEYAGRLVIVPCLEPDEEAVGAKFSIEHRSPAGLGAVVTARAVVSAATRRRLTCDVSAWCEDRLLAEGSFVQISLPKDELTKRFRAATPKRP